MTPDVDTFVVDHEQTSHDPSWGVEVDPISVSDVLVVPHKLGSLCIVTNVFLLMLRTGDERFLVFFLFFFLLLLCHVI